MKRRLASSLLLSLLCFVSSAYAQQSSAGSQADQAISQARTISNLASQLSRFNSFPKPLSNLAAALALSRLALDNSGQAQEVPVGITRDAPVLAPAYLPATVTGTDASTDDANVNVSLQPGIRFAGNVTGAPVGGTVFALATDGSFSTSSVFSPPMNRFQEVVAPNMYNVNACYTNSLGGPRGTFAESVPVDLTSGDVLNHDLALPLIAVYPVMGRFSPPLLSPIAIVLFSSTDGTTSGSSGVRVGGTYSLQVPIGVYRVWLTQVDPVTMSSSTVPLGMVTVSGPTTANFTVPPTDIVTGTVVMADGSPLQPNSVVMATDVNARAGSPGSCAQSANASGFSSIGPAGGFVLNNLAAFFTYNLVVVQPFGSNSSVLYQDPNTVAPITENITIPALPAGMPNIFGTVTGPDGAGVPGVGVTALTMEVVGAPNVSFFGSTTTGMDGSYTIPVLQGTSYTVVFNPAVPSDF